MSAVAYWLGSVAGGTVVGFGLGLVGALSAPLLRTQFVLMLLTAVALAAGVFPGNRLWPERGRQVPRWWVSPPTLSGLFLAGFVLGAGLFTYIRYTAYYVAVASMVAAGTQSIWLATTIGMAYGMVNGIMPRLRRGTSGNLAGKRQALVALAASWSSRGVSILIAGLGLYLSCGALLAKG